MRLYPAQWRVRYGVEFQYLLDDAHAGWPDFFDILKGGLKMRLTMPLPIPYVDKQEDYLMYFSRNRKIVAGLAIAVLLLAAGWLLLPQAEYQASSLILVDPAKVTESKLVPLANLDVGARLDIINQQMMSSTRLQRIIDTYDLYRPLKGHKTQEEIIQTMRSDIKVEVVPNLYERADGAPRAFRISYRYPIAPMAAQIANQLASLFIEENLRIREQFVEGNVEFLDTRLEKLRQQLSQAEAQLASAKSAEERAAQTRDLALLREYYAKLFTQRLELITDEDAEKRQKSERFTILDPARIPEKPWRLRPRFLTAEW
jgi:uncharacterized protein involved in exopolysaccharide biosynthesis